MKKGIIWAMIILIFIVFLIIFLLSLETSTQLILEDGMTINPVVCAKIEAISGTKNILIHQLGCPHCAITVNILREIEQENNLKISYYDLAIENERREVLNEMNILTKGVPTLIANCKVYVGQRSKEDYLKIL